MNNQEDHSSKDTSWSITPPNVPQYGEYCYSQWNYASWSATNPPSLPYPPSNVYPSNVNLNYYPNYW